MKEYDGLVNTIYSADSFVNRVPVIAWMKGQLASKVNIFLGGVEVKNEIHATLDAIILFIIHLETMEITKPSPQKFTTHYRSAYPLVVGALGGKQFSPMLVQACPPVGKQTSLMLAQACLLASGLPCLQSLPCLPCLPCLTSVPIRHQGGRG